MRLKTIMKKIKGQFMIDDELRAYKYEDRIELFEYSAPAIDLNGNKVMDGMESRLFVLYYNKDNVITTIEHNCLTLITTRNVCLYKCLIKLLGETIIDLDKYKYAYEYMFPYSV